MIGKVKVTYPRLCMWVYLYLFLCNILSHFQAIQNCVSVYSYMDCFPLYLLHLKKNKYIYLFLAVLGLHCCVWAFSSHGEQGLLFVAVRGLLIAVVSLVAEHRLQARRLQQLWHTGSRAQAQQLWHTGLVAPQNVGSSRTRARTRVPCIGRRILNHCATREAPKSIFKKLSFILSP